MASGRCAECRASVDVAEDFAHGAQIRCPSCQTSLRVVRRTGAGIGLVHSDIAPLREALSTGEQRQAVLERDLASARASLGIGVNGLGLGVLYLVAKIGLEDLPLTQELVVNAVLIAVAAGIGLELANLLFLAKRKQMALLSTEIDQLEEANRRLRRQVRDAMRG